MAFDGEKAIEVAREMATSTDPEDRLDAVQGLWILNELGVPGTGRALDEIATTYFKEKLRWDLSHE